MTKTWAHRVDVVGKLPERKRDDPPLQCDASVVCRGLPAFAVSYRKGEPGAGYENVEQFQCGAHARKFADFWRVPMPRAPRDG